MISLKLENWVRKVYVLEVSKNKQSRKFLDVIILLYISKCQNLRGGHSERMNGGRAEEFHRFDTTSISTSWDVQYMTSRVSMNVSCTEQYLSQFDITEVFFFSAATSPALKNYELIVLQSRFECQPLFQVLNLLRLLSKYEKKTVLCKKRCEMKYLSG